MFTDKLPAFPCLNKVGRFHRQLLSHPTLSRNVFYNRNFGRAFSSTKYPASKLVSPVAISTGFYLFRNNDPRAFGFWKT
jgi:hypothetical protein